MKKIYSLVIYSLMVVSVPLHAQTYSGEEIETIKRMAGSDPLATYQMGYLYETGKYERKNERKALKMYEAAAAEGIDSAQFALGRFYLQSIVVDKNEVIARRYFELAARQNHAQAIMALAGLYENGGEKVKEDYNKAISYYLQAWNSGVDIAKNKLEALPLDAYPEQTDPILVRFKASRGDAENEYLTGRMHQYGDGVEKNLKKAFEYYASASKKGNSKAQLSLGLMYADGLYVSKNLNLAVYHLLKAANNNEAEAVNKLSEYDLSSIVKDQNNTSYQLYLANNGEIAAQYQLYKRYLVGDDVPQNKEKALEYVQSAALKNYEPAIMELGRMYENGSALVEKSAENAFRWYRRAAFIGNDSAKYILGQMYEEGRGVDQDINKAIRYYLQAANNRIEMADFKLSKYEVLDYIAANDLEYVLYQARKGVTLAQFKVGSYYLNKNSSESVFWLQKAAEKNNSVAQVLLGDIFLNGKANQPIDLAKAKEYYQMAAKNGEIPALKALAELLAQSQSADGQNLTDLDLAFDFANKYLAAVKNDPKEQIDMHIYFVIGKIYSERGSYIEAIQNYRIYINAFDASTNRPTELIQALHQRALAFVAINDYKSALNDFEIALLEVNKYMSDEELSTNSNALKEILGNSLYQSGVSLLVSRKIDEGCKMILIAKKNGVSISEDYLNICNSPDQINQP